jgi:hypothetical protein
VKSISYVVNMVPRRGRMQLSEFNDLQILRTFFSSMISLCFLTKGPHRFSPQDSNPHARFSIFMSTDFYRLNGDFCTSVALAWP